MIDLVDFSVNEQCVKYGECDKYAAFIDADKPVFHIEYPDSAPDVSASEVDRVCTDEGDAEGTSKFSTLVKNMNVDGWVEYCNGHYATTEMVPED